MLYHLGYVSTQTRPLSADDLVALLKQARARNQANGVTGLLLHREDSFFQVLEGNQEQVMQIFSSIERDPRHNRVEVLFQGPTATREFSDWRMGFVELDGVDVDRLPGFSDFLASGAGPRQLLKEFTETQRLMLLFRSMQ
ncbi:MAG: BLUF domain-containing protein [Gammaproteobacteria bacterium]|nr:BLUF domain-containing protein [Gammaproteobacteria bacterium]